MKFPYLKNNKIRPIWNGNSGYTIDGYKNKVNLYFD
jgi:hypothetical protein